MAQTLKQYMRTHHCAGFRAVPHYFPDGDFLTYFWADSEAYEKRHDEFLTVYHSTNTHEIVGVKVKGVRHIMKTAANFSISLDDGEVQLGMLFLCMAVNDSAKEKALLYEGLSPFAKGVSVQVPGVLCGSSAN